MIKRNNKIISKFHTHLCRIRDRSGVSKHVDREAANGGEEDLDVRPGDELGVHAVRLIEESLAKVVLGAPEPLRDRREVPHWLNRRFGDVDLQ